MGQRTLHLRQHDKKGLVGIDGTRVCVLHPDAPTQILEMPHRSEAEAEATLKKVLHDYFNSRHGWEVVVETKHLDTSTWIPPEPKPPTEAQIEAANARERGWLVTGDTMVLSLSRNHRASDLDMALEHARLVTTLHVLVSEDDGMARTRLFEHLVGRTAEWVTTLTLESPWAPNTLASLSLGGLGEVLQKRRLVSLGALGVFEWPDALLPGLAQVRVQNASLKPAEIKRICKLPDLRVVQLRMPKKDAPHRAAIAGLPLAQLDELAVEYFHDVGKLMTALLDAGANGLPKRVHLQGFEGAGFEAALTRWKQEASACELTFGKDLSPRIWRFGVQFRDSPFDANAAIYAPFG